MTILEKSLCLSYILSKMLDTNLETALCELKDQKHYDAGKLEFNIGRLKQANNKAFKVIEKNLKHNNSLEQLQENIETLINASWE